MPPKKKPVAPPDPFPIVVETFQSPDYELRSLASGVHREPSAFNGTVRVHRYRITAERIDEPADVIHERIRKLWRECDNYRMRTPLEMAAKHAGITLDRDQCGVDRKTQP